MDGERKRVYSGSGTQRIRYEKQKRYQDYLEKKKEFEEKNQSIKDDNDENYKIFKNQLIALGPEPPKTSIPTQYHNPILLRQLVYYLNNQMVKSFNEAIKLYNRDLRNYTEMIRKLITKIEK